MGVATNLDWVQLYDPLGSPWLSTALAAVPIVALLGLLVAGQSAPRAAGVAFALALGVAILGFGMPGRTALAAALYGGWFWLSSTGCGAVAAGFLFLLTFLREYIE